MNKTRVIDSETDGLNATKIHVLSWTDDGVNYHSTGDYEKMSVVLTQKGYKFVCHNGIRYDMGVFNRILGLDMHYKNFVDTLGLSWYLFPQRSKHGLEEWGKDLGVEKPVVKDWKNLSYEEYAHRCEEDVKINYLLWLQCKSKLEELYGT